MALRDWKTSLVKKGDNMKTVEEIAKTPNLLIEANNEAGGYGRLVYGNLKNALLYGAERRTGSTTMLVLHRLVEPQHGMRCAK